MIPNYKRRDRPEELAKRCKRFEEHSERDLITELPIMARVDGRAFHSFTRDMERPFDENLVAAMQLTMERTSKEISARFAFTQSDEISFLLLANSGGEVWFDGRQFKMVSCLAAFVTAQFHRAVREYFPATRARELLARCPTFDARVWNVPTLDAARESFVWRQMDAERNSVAMAAQSVFTAEELHKKNVKTVKEMLLSKGINWESYLGMYKRGSFMNRRMVRSKFTFTERAALPPKHEAHTNPNLEVWRPEWVLETERPPIKEWTNFEHVATLGAVPQTA